MTPGFIRGAITISHIENVNKPQLIEKQLNIVTSRGQVQLRTNSKRGMEQDSLGSARVKKKHLCEIINQTIPIIFRKGSIWLIVSKKVLKI